MTEKPKQQQKRKPDWWVIVIIIVLVIGTFFFFQNLFRVPELTLNEAQLIEQIQQGNIEIIEFQPAGGINRDTWTFRARLHNRIDENRQPTGSATQGFIIVRGNVFNGTTNGTSTLNLIQQGVEDHGGSFNVIVVNNFDWLGFILTIVPVAFMIILIIVIFKSLSGGGANKQAFDFGKNRARLAKGKEVTFKDVAGAEEEKVELEELIDFLKNPKKYVAMGAKIPKGVLLVGPPGTGKTLLAKAVSGEANVPFFSISGSDFVEMFVGVGASRVRDLFKVAKENSPCIIFIDEIDAVGRQRGAGLGGGHDEREQTLNQLLVEMDGFSTNLGIIIIAATNRPDVLDPALLRPGRFDRQVTIDLPDAAARTAILKVHARNKAIASDVNFNHVSMRIPGFSGADIANVLNEAALLAARDNRNLITEKDIDEAIDRVMMGPAKKSKKYTDDEKKVVAYHEAGHAVIGLKLKDARVVQKVTIIPRGRTGGYNLMTPAQETYLSSKETLLAEITSFLGGRVAEEIQFKTITTGAYGDFASATKIARAMVTEYGMSNLGPIQYETTGGNVFLGRDYLKEKNFSDQVALEIDKEVRRIITGCYDQAKTIIAENKQLLDRIVHYLLVIETLSKTDIDEIAQTGQLKRYDSLETNN